MLKRISLVFSAGCVGAIANSIAAWAFGALGITGALGVSIAPALTPGFLYPRIVWGGIWGALFLLPLKGSLITRGLLCSIGPTVVQLFVVFPYKAGKGMMGLELGVLTPVFVVILNAVWGIAAVYYLRTTGER